MTLATGETLEGGRVHDADFRTVIAQGPLSRSSAPALAATVTAVKTSAGILDGGTVFNPHATIPAYVQIFDKAAAVDVTLGSDVADDVIGVGPLESVEIPGPVAYALGIQVAGTTTTTGAVAATTPLVLSARYR